MKKAFAAALTISLLAGTSAFAQERHQRADGGDWRERVAQHQQEAQKQQEDRKPAREQSDETRPARPVPQVANPRAEEAIAQARARQTEHDAVVVERRNDHANEAIAETRAHQDEQRVEQRHVVPRVIPQDQQRRYDRGGDNDQHRYDRRDNNDEQRIYIRPDTRQTNEADRRAEVQRRLQEAERNRDHDRDHNWSRPGDHQLRDRDHNRHWYNPDQWRRSYWAQHRYRVPYRYQPGWYSRTWIFGDFLPRGWYTPSYYLDWWSYGLPMPPIGAEWVRSGDDALLVDTWSGEVLSVYYDLFW